jgi:putative membrane protein
MSPVFAALHPWVPFSWVVRAGRAAMFGAFDGAWLPALGMVALFCVASVAIASVLGRWKFVARHRFVPLLDV